MQIRTTIVFELLNYYIGDDNSILLNIEQNYKIFNLVFVIGTCIIFTNYKIWIYEYYLL